MKKRLLILIILIAFAFFVLQKLNDGKELLTLVKQANPTYIAISIGIQFVYYFLYTTLYKKAFELFNIKWRLRQVVPMVLASQFINLFAPLGALSGTGVFLQKGKKQGATLITITASIFIIMLVEFLGLFIILLLSFAILYFKYSITTAELVGLFVLFALIASIVSILLMGLYASSLLTKIFSFVGKVFSTMREKLFHKKPLKESWVKEKTEEFIDISSTLKTQMKPLRNLLGIAFLKHIAQIATFFFLFLAFGTQINLVSLTVGYSIGILFWIVVPAPQGIGVVEGLMPLLFSSLGVNIGAATLSVLAFRGFTVWIPALLGFISLNKVIHSDTETEIKIAEESIV